jgi:energy-coupling factor transporter ATP-binding protein EcfA2
MHITEGFLPIAHCIAWGAASLPPTVVAVRSISRNLEARNVSFAYGSGAYGPGNWTIRNLSFQLPAPRRVCLLGANGVGKSTLMMLINGTLRPQEGEMLVLDKRIDYSRSGLKELRRRVGIVLQDPDDQLFGATVEQDVSPEWLVRDPGAHRRRDAT